MRQYVSHVDCRAALAYGHDGTLATDYSFGLVAAKHWRYQAL